MEVKWTRHSLFYPIRGRFTGRNRNVILEKMGENSITLKFTVVQTSQ